MNLMLYLHTLIHLKASQIFWTLSKKINRNNELYYTAPKHRILKRRHTFPQKREAFSEGSIYALGQHIRIGDWSLKNKKRLLIYNAHYFNFLPKMNYSKGSKIIDHWIRHNPIGKPDAWDPYPTSLRIVNWIKFNIQSGSLTSNQLNNLFSQKKHLEKNIEKYLLGNHYFENLKALLIASMFFNLDNKGKLFRFKLNEQIAEQILGDGFHFERSPMYHLLFLEGWLDIIEFHKIFNIEYPPQWHYTCGKMLRVAQQMTHDGEVLHFNDSTSGVALPLKHIEDYAKKIGIEPQGKGVSIHHSKYWTASSNDMEMVVDGGIPSPPYQPGHSHAATGSFELAFKGKRVLVQPVRPR